ncbi:MAG: hypothetical protein U0X40_07305 [Ferruginibacter sp.]
MKKIILLPLLCFSLLTLTAQKDFHGEIIYNIHSSLGDKSDATLNIIFGENRVRLRFKENDEYDKEELLIKLDSGLSYAINYRDSSFRKRKMARFPETVVPGKRIIAGYGTSPVSTANNGLSIAMSSFAEISSQVAYVSDSLFYHIPASLAGNTELMAVLDNRIVLGLTISRSEKDKEDDAPGQLKEAFVATAVSVNAYEPAAENMEVPASFTDRRNNSSTAVDSVSTTPVPDTVISKPRKTQPKKSPVSSKPRPAAGKTKPAAQRPKE